MNEIRFQGYLTLTCSLDAESSSYPTELEVWPLEMRLPICVYQLPIKLLHNPLRDNL